MEAKLCQTILISDTPSLEDKFGPHERLAQAIANLISNHKEGGKTIGLEGGWGSGKSTVINLLKYSLVDNQNILLINFDAWAHQGDPLRRTFLETLISTIITERDGWIKKDYWKKQLLELAKRLKTTTEKNFPQLKPWGKALLIAALFVPFGIPFLEEGLRKELTLVRGLPIAWEFILGLIFTLAPIWVLIALYGTNIWKKQKQHNNSKSPLSQDAIKDAQQDDTILVLIQQTIKETKSETIESIDPTSIEFENKFVELMREALYEDERRIVLVLDNLDRVDSQEALSILSTMQTFLQHQAVYDTSWLSRLWVIIPYDKNSLEKLWKKTPFDREKPLAVSFLDKRFQIRFEVPPLVLSDWSKYLKELLREAFPDHDNTEFHLTYRVYALYREYKEKAPTPRDLKIYVNQIGALHRQWQDNFPMPHMGFYVLLMRKGFNIDYLILWGDIKKERPELILGQNIYDNLAAMYFNVVPALAQQLVLKEPITNALGEGDVDKLINLSKQPGFEQVLEDVSISEWIPSESFRLAKAARSLEKIEILHKIDPFVAKSLKQSFRNATLSVTNWGIFDKDIGQGVASLIIMLGEDREIFTKAINAVTSTQFREDQETELFKSIDAWIEGIIALFDELKDKVTVDLTQLTGNIKIPTSAKGYIEACAHFSDRDPGGNYWSLITPQADISQIVIQLGEIAKTDELSKGHLSAIRVMKAGQAKIDWGPLITEIGNRLKTSAFYSPEVVSVQLSILWELIQDDSKSLQLLESLAQEGYLLHHLSKAISTKETIAWCLLSFAFIYPDFRAVTVIGDSESGHTFINQLFNQPDQYKEITEQFVQLLSATNQHQLLYKILDSSPNSKRWLGSAFAIASKRSDLNTFFPSEEVRIRWEYFCEEFEESEFEQFIGELIKVSDLIDAVIRNKFEIKDVCLYATLVRKGGSEFKKFTDWCINNLLEVQTSDWVSAFEQEGNLLDLVVDLVDQGIDFDLESNYQDALENHAKHLLEGNAKVEYFENCWRSILTPLPSHRRKNLVKRIINSAKERDGNIPSQFFVLYGDEMLNRDVLKVEDGVFLNLFTPLLRSRNIKGVEWLSTVIDKLPDLFIDEGHSDIKEFRDRVAEMLSDSENSLGIEIDRIAQKLGISRKDEDQKDSNSQN